MKTVLKSTPKEFIHTPVMLKEVLQFLQVKPDGTYVDATVGGAGHSIEIAKQLKTGKLFCFDKDPDALNAAGKKLAPFECATLIESSFSHLQKQLEQFNIKAVDGVLFDLGVSSFQLDEPSRGFSFQNDGPLDMRMSKKGPSAFEIVNSFSAEKLEAIILKFGEERFAKAISRKIVLERQNKPISTTGQLAEIVKSAVPAKFKRKKNPCKKTFQAIRICTNNELEELKLGLNDAFEILKPGGRIVALSFHSLEDKLVKHKFVELSQGCICPPKTPICICNNKPKAKILNKKPVVPTENEAELNPRSKSVKLRALEKL